MTRRRRPRWRVALALFLWLNLAAPPPALLAGPPDGEADGGHGCCCATSSGCLCRLAPGGGGCDREGGLCLLSQRPVRDGDGEAPAAAPVLRLARPEMVLERPDPAPGRRIASAAPPLPSPPPDPPDPPPPRV